MAIDDALLSNPTARALRYPGLPILGTLLKRTSFAALVTVAFGSPAAIAESDPESPTPISTLWSLVNENRGKALDERVLADADGKRIIETRFVIAGAPWRCEQAARNTPKDAPCRRLDR